MLLCWFAACLAPLGPAQEPPARPRRSEQDVEEAEETRRHEQSAEEAGVPAELTSWLFAGVRDWRAALADAGYSLEAFLTADASAHVSGGADPGSKAYRGLFDAIVTVDTGRAFGLEGGKLVVGVQALGGGNGSADVGVLQNYSNIDAADDRVQLTRVWYQHEWREGRTRLRLGKLDANAQFAGVAGAARFLHSSMGFSPTVLGLPTYPDPAFGVVAVQELGPGLNVRVGVFDGAGQEGVKTGQDGPGTVFGEPADLFLIGQAGWTWARHSPHAGRLAFGAWEHSGDFTRFDGGSDDGTSGLYALFEQGVNVHGRELEAFLQLGEADEDVAAITRHVGLGLSASGVFLPERDDALGAGVSWAKLSDAPGTPFSEDAETAIEVFYGLKLLPGVRLKPDLQYISDPGGDASVSDAWIFTLRMTVSL